MGDKGEEGGEHTGYFLRIHRMGGSPGNVPDGIKEGVKEGLEYEEE